MRSHGRHKRSKTNKDLDSEIYKNIQGEDVHTNNYSRSRNSLENYRAVSSSTYNSDRDRAPHSHRDDGWRHAAYDHERYAYNDIYSRGDRLDDYDDGGRRDAGTWRTVDSGDFSSRHDWPHHYDHVGTSSYHESWAVPPSSAYESNRSSYTGHWQERGSREQPVEDWENQAVRGDHFHDRGHEWHLEGQRDKNTQRQPPSDSGWSARRREREWTRDTSTQNSSSMGDRQDRSWEPAASWKSSNRNNQQQQSQNQRTQNGQKNNGKSKRGHNQHKQRRERLTDDGDLNK